jgi:ferredoxin
MLFMVCGISIVLEYIFLNPYCCTPCNFAYLTHASFFLLLQRAHKIPSDTPIHVGDVLIGVFDDVGFKESTTALDYDETVNVINQAKKHSLDHGGHGKLTLELNRLVKRATVSVEIEDPKTGQVTQTIQGLAGDNLRLLLLHNHVDLYDETTHRLDQPFLTGSNCAGEGICGTCLVKVQQGMAHLNKVGPQEESILKNRRNNWRAACKTVVGADNQPDTTLRILLHPQSQEKHEVSFSP